MTFIVMKVTTMILMMTGSRLTLIFTSDLLRDAFKNYLADFVESKNALYELQHCHVLYFVPFLFAEERSLNKWGFECGVS